MRSQIPEGQFERSLSRVVTDGALTERRAEFTVGLHILYRSEDLTVLNVVWPPLMTLFPHDHRMWAAIGIYSGREDNAFYRRDGDRGHPFGGRELADGAVLLLGDDVIHSRPQPGPVCVYGRHSCLRGRFRGNPAKSVGPDDTRRSSRTILSSSEASSTGPSGLSEPRTDFPRPGGP